jgi:flagellin-like hook-associated protein FlgL
MYRQNESSNASKGRIFFMSNSIVTNAAALIALVSLRASQSPLFVASKESQAGYRVSEAQDDTSTFSVVQANRRRDDNKI